MCLSYSELSAILCSLFSVFTLFYLMLENMSTKNRDDVVFLVIFDTCDVVYNWSISLMLPPKLYLIIYLIFAKSTQYI